MTELRWTHEGVLEFRYVSDTSPSFPTDWTPVPSIPKPQPEDPSHDS